MNPKLLKLKPKRYLCPYCGEWHEWELSNPLEDYDGEEWEIYDSWEGEYVVSTGVADLRCPNDLEDYDDRHIYFRFKEGKCYFKTFSECDSKKEIDSRILINDIVESDKKPRVIFHVPFTSETEVNNMSCEDCGSKDVCIVCKLGEKNDGYHMEIPFGFEFDKDDYMRYSNVWRLAHEQALKEQRQNARKWASQNGQRNKQAGNCQEQVTEATQPKDKEETTMANNILNMNMEFGPNQDENIASTLMGIAVKNGDSWRIYDKQKKEITDIGDMSLGNLPIFILPTTKLAEGDLIKDGDEYYFVIKVQKGSTQTLCAKTGEMKTVIPIKNILGLSCYSKVIALSDKLNMSDDFDVEELAIMSTMCGQNAGDNGQMNQLLPLMFFKDKLGENDDTVKMIMLSSMMAKPAEDGASTSGTANMNQWLPLLLMKDKSKEGENGEKSDLMDIVLMASMMGNNMDGNNNFLMGYLMIDMLNKKKKEEKPSETTD